MIYIGTKLEPEEHHAFKVRAAEAGKSASAMLRELTLAFITKPAKPTRKTKKGSKA